jgi:hypothetical protein
MLISEFRYSKQLFFRLWNYFRVDINKLYKKKFNNCKFEITSYEIAYYSESEFSMVALVFTVFESFNIKSGLITVPAFAPRFFNQFLPLINASIDLSWKPFFFEVSCLSIHVGWKIFRRMHYWMARKKETNAYF